jgi:hypothetical protein
MAAISVRGVMEYVGHGNIAVVDVWEHEGRLFEVVMASDVIRGGVALELTDLGSSESGATLEAFWHDDGSGFDFIAHHTGALPFAVVERFVDEAKKRLPPADGSEGDDARRVIG